MDDNKPSIWLRAIGWAILLTTVWTIPAAILGWWWSLPVVFLCIVGITLSAPLETILSSRERMYRHRAEVVRLRRMTETEPPRALQPEAPQAAPTLTREEAAREFWVKACKVAKATGSLGWRGGFKQYLSDSAEWGTWVRDPLVAAGMAMRVNTGNGESAAWKEGVTPDYVMGWLSANLPPLPPEGWPPQWRKPQTADSETGRKQAETGFGQADTVYAKDV